MEQFSVVLIVEQNMNSKFTNVRQPLRVRVMPHDSSLNFSHTMTSDNNEKVNVMFDYQWLLPVYV